MFVVRFISLAALALLLAAGSTTQSVFHQLSADVHWVTAACGAVMTGALFVMKFVGPPPHAFVPRAALAFTIAVVSIYAIYGGYVTSWARPAGTLMTVNLVLGSVLLAFYARE